MIMVRGGVLNAESLFPPSQAKEPEVLLVADPSGATQEGDIPSFFAARADFERGYWRQHRPGSADRLKVTHRGLQLAQEARPGSDGLQITEANIRSNEPRSSVSALQFLQTEWKLVMTWNSR
jgi:hypothetical protein